MKIKVYCVFDVVAEIHMAPFVASLDAVASRSFATCVNDERHAFYSNPADYFLVKIGEFDQTSGVLEAFEVPRRVCSGVDVAEDR